MNPAAEAFKLVSLIYEAVEDPSLWNVILGSLQKSLSGPVSLNIFSPLTNRGTVLADAGHDPAAIRSYNEHYGEVNYYIRRAGPQMRTGWVVSSDQLCSDLEVAKTEYYDGFLRPYDMFHMLGAVISQTPSLGAYLTVYRSRRSGPYSPEDRKLIELLMPHLQRAARLHQKFNTLQAGVQVLESLSMGTIVVSSEGRPLVMNEQAKRTLNEADGLSLDRRGVLRAGPLQNRRLHELISEASQAAEGNGLGAGGTLAVQRPSDKRAYFMFVTPYRSKALDFSYAGARAILFVVDPESRPELAIESLARLFLLTTSEARLAALLAEGKSLLEAGEVLHVSRSTARSHLQHLFQKLEVRRQAELVTLLLRTTGQLRFPS